jgi:hypothetical protein
MTQIKINEIRWTFGMRDTLKSVKSINLCTSVIQNIYDIDQVHQSYILLTLPSNYCC